MPLISTLKDPFNTGSINATTWGTFVSGSATIAETTVMAITPAASTSSSNGTLFSNTTTYDLTGGSILVNILSVCPANVNNFFTLKLDGSNQIQWEIDGGTLRAQKTVAGSQSDIATATYNSTTHAWLRIRESGGNTFFDYSSNGINWNNLTSLANPFSMTTFQNNFGVFEFASQASPGSFIFCNLNYPPSNFLSIFRP